MVSAGGKSLEPDEVAPSIAWHAPVRKTMISRTNASVEEVPPRPPAAQRSILDFSPATWLLGTTGSSFLLLTLGGTLCKGKTSIQCTVPGSAARRICTEGRG